MKRSTKHAIAGFVLAAMTCGGMVTATAASPSETECAAMQGTYSKTNGTVTCTVTTVDPVGNSESSGGKSQTRDTSTSDSEQGNITPKDHNAPTSDCSGPGNSKNC